MFDLPRARAETREMPATRQLQSHVQVIRNITGKKKFHPLDYEAFASVSSLRSSCRIFVLRWFLRTGRSVRIEGHSTRAKTDVCPHAFSVSGNRATGAVSQSAETRRPPHVLETLRAPGGRSLLEKPYMVAAVKCGTLFGRLPN